MVDAQVFDFVAFRAARELRRASTRNHLAFRRFQTVQDNLTEVENSLSKAKTTLNSAINLYSRLLSATADCQALNRKCLEALERNDLAEIERLRKQLRS